MTTTERADPPVTASPAFEQRDVVLHGRRVSYVQRGDLRRGVSPIVFLHGLASSSTTWLDLLDRLPADLVAIAVDLPGHGLSDRGSWDYTLAGHANSVRDLLETIGVARATFVGHSYGGGVVMQLMYQRPDMCERLVLVSSGGLGSDVSWKLRLLSLPGAELVLPVIGPTFVRDTGNAICGQLHKIGIGSPRLHESWRAFSTLTHPDNRAPFLRTLRGVIGPSGQVLSATDRLHLAAEIPSLIVWGAQDDTIPVAHAHVAHEHLPNSELLILANSSHFPHHEQPQACADALSNFLARTSPPPKRLTPHLIPSRSRPGTRN
jgi:pimeloyl-ACP methyl ester carboxylesterase